MWGGMGVGVSVCGGGVKVGCVLMGNFCFSPFGGGVTRKLYTVKWKTKFFCTSLEGSACIYEYGGKIAKFFLLTLDVIF